MPPKKKVYMDACVFIDIALLMAGHTDRIADLENAKFAQRLVAAAIAGKIEIWTSALTIGECLRTGDKKPSEETKNFYRNLLHSEDGPIQRALPTWEIVEESTEFCWTHGITGLRSVDAFHLATSKVLECDEFITSETFMTKHGTVDWAAIGINAIQAKQTKALPPEYVSDTLFDPTTDETDDAEQEDSDGTTDEEVAELGAIDGNETNGNGHDAHIADIEAVPPIVAEEGDGTTGLETPDAPPVEP